MKKRHAKLAASSLAVVMVLALSISQINAEPVLSFDESTGRDVGNGPFSIGWTFDVVSPITVTGLGWYDEGGNGLEEAHRVGIWGPPPDYALLYSALVPTGTAPLLDGQFRTLAINSFMLSVGSGYTVGGQTNAGVSEKVVGGTNPFSTVTQTVDSRINYRYPVTTVDDPSFARPNFQLGDWGLYGPSFSVFPAPTPTPTPVSPLSIIVSSNSAAPGDSFTLGISLQQNITQPFDFYLVMAAPNKNYTVFLSGSIATGIRPLYSNILAYPAPYSKTIWDGITVPQGLSGTFIFYAGVVEAGKLPQASSLEQIDSQTPNIIFFDKEIVTVQ